MRKENTAYFFCKSTYKISLYMRIREANIFDRYGFPTDQYAQLPAVVTIPQGASTEKCAFSYCDTIESLVVEPDAKIKSRSFGYCDKLTLLVCGDGCQLEDKAFEYCRDLGKVFLCGDVKTEQETFSYCGEFELTEAAADEYEALKKSAVFGSLKGS